MSSGTNALPLQQKSKGHTAASAAMLLMGSALLSGLLGLVRIKYVNYLFGAGPAQDAYRAAFKLPDLLVYFMTGGAVAISLVTILNRYREAGDEEGAERALSTVLSTMFVVLLVGVLLCEILAPWYVTFANKGFRADPLRAHLCTELTRIILPGQLFFFIGSCLSARLQVRKIFIYQAGVPLIYNLGIIAGAVLLHRQMGIYSLAVGVLLGVICGSLLLNVFGALRTGLRFRPNVDFRDTAFREWLHLTWPLMVGVSLVMFDGFFLNYFGSMDEGGITLLGVSKDLFNASFNIIGPAAGAASLPFFASLYQQKRAFDFSASVSRSVSRLFAVGMLVSAWMMALAPWLMDLFRGGKFKRADADVATQLFTILVATLAVWAVQGIYARAFYAASDTKTPAITGTIITVLSVPMYAAFFHADGLRGLTIASDLGIIVQTATLAILLHKKRLVSLAQLEVAETLRALLAAVVSFAATYVLAHHLPATSSHKGDFLHIAAGSVLWGVAAFGTLLATGSKLPQQLLRRRKA